MKIKVCGMKEPANIQAVAGLNPDYMGFIFYEASPRFVNELAVDDIISVEACKTGVFVDAPFDKMVADIEKYNLCAVQLHGKETPGICEALKKRKPMIQSHITIVTKGGREVKKDSSVTQKTVVLNRYVEVIKAFGVDENFDFCQLNAYADVVDYFLFDTKTPAHGGSGKTFDWTLLDNYQLDVPFFLSGGISLDNLEQIKNIKHPAFYGVDLNSRFETAPGMKNIDKLKQAFAMFNTTSNEIRS
jgi:phosphoribosylanthranilate isomerase